jgi:hypothetical protein
VFISTMRGFLREQVRELVLGFEISDLSIFLVYAFFVAFRRCLGRPTRAPSESWLVGIYHGDPEVWSDSITMFFQFIG